MVAQEVGYRAQLRKSLLFDLAAFCNIYDNLRGTEPGAPFLESSPPPSHLVLPLSFQNSLFGQTRGIELAANWSVINRWRLSGGYTWFSPGLRGVATTTGTISANGRSPQQQWNLRSYLSLPGNLEFDTALYYVSKLSDLGTPSYTRLDTRIGWRPRESVEFSLVGQNLLQARHSEFGSRAQAVSATRVKRSIYGKLTWRF